MKYLWMSSKGEDILFENNKESFQKEAYYNLI